MSNNDNSKHSISATIGGNVIDIIYIGKLEIHTVLSYHLATYSVWPGPLFIVLHLALTAKTFDAPGIDVKQVNVKKSWKTWKTWKIGYFYKKSGKTWNSQGTLYNFYPSQGKQNI